MRQIRRFGRIGRGPSQSETQLRWGVERGSDVEEDSQGYKGERAAVASFALREGLFNRFPRRRRIGS